LTTPSLVFPSIKSHLEEQNKWHWKYMSWSMDTKQRHYLISTHWETIPFLKSLYLQTESLLKTSKFLST
jgi:sulfur relay (sulfurtransferase) DsrC/TusE family protein